MFESLSRIKNYDYKKLVPVSRKRQDEMLYQQLASLVSQANSNLKNLGSLDETIASLAVAIEKEQDPNTKANLSTEYESLIKLQELQGSNLSLLIDKILSREGLDEGETDQLLNKLEELGDIFSSLPNQAVDVSLILKTLESTLSDTRLSEDIRLNSLTDLVSYAETIKDEQSLLALKSIDSTNIDSQQSQKVIEQTISRFTDNLEATKKLSLMLHEEDKKYSAEEINTLKELLRSSSQHTDSLHDLERISQDTSLDNQTREEQTQAILKNLRSVVFETKVLHSLRDLNKSFDSAALNKDKVNASLKNNDLKKEVRKRPEFITKGRKGATKTVAGGVMSLLGLSAIDEVFGVSDAISDYIEDSAADRKNKKTGGKGDKKTGGNGDGRPSGNGDKKTGGKGDGRPSGNGDEKTGGNGDKKTGGNGDGRPSGNGDGRPSGNGDGRPSGNGDGRPSGNGDGRPSGNGDGRPSGNGDGRPSGNGDGRPSGNGDGRPSGNGDGRPSGNGDGRPSGKKSVLTKAKDLATTGISKLGPKSLAIGGGLAAAGLTAYEYTKAEDTAGRKDAIGSGAGAAVGGALGTLIPIPVVGTLAGAAVGSWLGSKLANWFTQPQDLIPDNIKSLGPIEQVSYIEDTLVPELVRAGKASDSTLGKLRDYEEKLLSKDSIQSWLEGQYQKVGKPAGQTKEQFTQSVLKSDSVQKLNYKAQDKIAAASGTPDAFVNPTAKRGSDGKFEKIKDVTPVSKEILAASDVGFVSKKYESGSKGVATISSGKGDPGGVSYGSYQLASKTGTMSKFLESKEGSAYAEKFKGLTPGSAEFNKVYAEVASADKEGFNKSQHDFIKRTHYDPVAATAQKYGYDINDRATQEMLWSQSVQHSAAGNQKIFERMKARGVDPSKMSKEDLIRETYAERAAYAGQFANVGTRYSREVEDVLAVNAATQETKTTDLTKTNSTTSVNTASVNPVSTTSVNTASVNPVSTTSVNTASVNPVSTTSVNTASVNPVSTTSVNTASVNPVSTTSVNTASVNPVSTTSVNPVSTTSVNPVSTTSVNPVSTTSVNPVSTTSVNPVSTTSVNPVSTTSVNPVSTTSVNPVSTTSVNTASVNPVSTTSVNTASVNPVSTTSVNTASVNPVSTTSVNPVSTTSVNPVSTTSFNPVSTTSFNPVSTTSFNPVSTTSFNPVSTTSVNPVSTTSFNPDIPTPSVTASVNPVSTTSVNPVSTTSVNPVSTTSFNPDIPTPSVTASVTSMSPPLGTEKADQVSASFVQQQMPVKASAAPVTNVNTAESGKAGVGPSRQSTIDNYGIAFANSMLFGR